MKKKQILTIAAFSLFLTFGVSGTAFAAGTWKNGTSGERYYIDENREFCAQIERKYE